VHEQPACAARRRGRRRRTSGAWSGGAGTFNPSASALNATYDPTPDEIARAA
jgi:hypothetical protein